MQDSDSFSFTVGCFALNTAFSSLETQLQKIRDCGFRTADVTDNSDGACLGVEFGFTALACLDGNPYDLRRVFEEYGLTISAYCAHANFLDPTAPWRYGTNQILKAVRTAATLGIPHVITTEGEPRTAFGHQLSESEALFSVCEKLYEPLRIAADHGVKILLEPHGPLTGDIRKLENLVNACDSPALGLNLDTGNFWLAGGDPMEFVERFGSLVQHVHWKDMPAVLEPQRGKSFGCGMSTIPLGTGTVNLSGVLEKLKRIGFSGYTTLEVAGNEAIFLSRDYLLSRGGKL